MQVSGVKVGIEKPPTVSQVAVDILIPIEEGIVLDGSNVGEDAACKIGTVIFVSNVSLIKEGKNKNIFFFLLPSS